MPVSLGGEAARRQLDSQMADAIRELNTLLTDEIEQKKFLESLHRPYVFEKFLIDLTGNDFQVPKTSSYLPLAKHYQMNLMVWAEKNMKDISADIGVDRSFLKEPLKREKILERISMITNIFQSYTYLVRWVLDPLRGKIPFKHAEALLAPTSVLFDLMHLIESNLPQDEDISSMVSGVIPKYTLTENNLWTNIFNDLLGAVHAKCTIQISPCVAEYKELKSKYICFEEMFNALRIVGKALFLSKINGVFEIFTEAASSWDFKSLNVRSNFPCTMQKFIFLACGKSYVLLCRFFGSKEIMMALFDIVKLYIHADLIELDKTGDPEKIQALVTAVYWINIATSQLYTPPEVLFTVEGARATIKYLAAEEIQNDVAETSIALYKLAIKEDAKFTPALRMNLCWCALNMLCMYSTAYILQHGRESYLSSIVLKNAAYIAECYVATLCYFQDTPIEQIEFWDPNYLFNMSATPAWFIALIKIRYEQDKQLNAGARSADTLSILEPPSNLAVSANKVDVTLLLNAIEHFCRMSLKIPFLIVGIPNWKGGIGLTHAHYVVRYLLDKLPVIVCDHIDKCQELGLLLPEALRVSHLAMKLAQAALGMPLDALRRAIESASKANGAPESSAETEKMAMVFSALSSISILEVFATGENHKFSCPPNLEKEFTAIGLVVFHTVQSLPESAFWDCNPESVRILSESVARMRVTDTLLSVVLPSDVQKGIERVYELAENHYRDIFAKMERMQEGGMDRKLDNLCFSAFISNNTDHVQDLDVLLAEARNASPTDTERAIKRSEVLAVLPCAYLGCTTSPGHGKSIINSKICSSCNIVRYCSVKCQKKDWKVHKVACQAVAAAAGSNK